MSFYTAKFLATVIEHALCSFDIECLFNVFLCLMKVMNHICAKKDLV